MTAWPCCTRCGNDTPAKWTVTAGTTAAKRDLIDPCCDRHLDPARTDARRWPHREVRPAGPGDGAIAPPIEQGSLW